MRSVAPWAWPWPVAVLVAVLLAGCAGSPDPSPAKAQAGCPLLYPDGSPVPCDASDFSDVEVLGPAPAPTTGWTCRDDSLADTGNRFQVWVHSDGRIGARWDMRAAPPQGQAVLYATLYQGGEGQVMVLPWQEVAFAAFPQAPSLDAPIEIHVVVADVRGVHANAVDPYKPEHWAPVPDAQVVVSTHGADPWFVVRVPARDGNPPAYLDLNGPDLTEAGEPMHRPKGNVPIAAGEVTYLAEVFGGGAKFPARDPVLLRANPGFCYAEDTSLLADVPPIRLRP